MLKSEKKDGHPETVTVYKRSGEKKGGGACHTERKSNLDPYFLCMCFLMVFSLTFMCILSVLA